MHNNYEGMLSKHIASNRILSGGVYCNLI